MGMSKETLRCVAKQVESELSFLTQEKLNMPVEEVERNLRNMERTEYKKEFTESKNCNLKTCRYNKDGQCTSEDKRKECIEVSRKVLCLEDKSKCQQRMKQTDNFSMRLTEKGNR